MRKITIDPITRLEGHGKIDIFLNEAGDVENAYLQIPELRGFEKFCEGKYVEELPRITPKICGVCPEAHHLAGTKAVDAVYNVDPPVAAKKLRELFYCAHMIHSHIAHFYALAGPDFILGPDAPPEQRNILGVVAKVGLDLGKEVIKHRAYAQQIQEMIGGRATQPVCGLPGGNSKSINEDERKSIEEKSRACLEFAKLTIKIFEDIVLKNKDYVDIILSKDLYYIETYYMGLVDKNNKVNFYDGNIRVVDPNGKEYVKFAPADYLKHMAEHVEKWSYMKFVYLKAIGWKGLVGGIDSGIYQVAPLGRLNASEGMATPLAQIEFEKMYKTLGAKPAHNTLANHWARVIEILYAAERMLELSLDADITSKDIRKIPTAVPDEGVGVVEAPRGTLFHHYKTDESGITKKVNLIVATGNNYAAMCATIAKVAKKLIIKGKADNKALNMVEMAFRTYDPCMSCATHAIAGEMPLILNVHDHNGNLTDSLRRD
ncbi:MAG TPA: Ni/Fe hydrogenase subunit alpha [Candidatus Wallbacteria bacterium]|nr:Ni/Fe hydrogenase subunit alpha [Candidatus Wallbacteria bacterium]